MKLQAKYLIAFLSNTLITLIVVGLSGFGFYQLNKTTNYLVTVNSRVLEYANLFEKNLAQSRRAEKELFIFPNKPEKQRKYVKSWNGSMDAIDEYLQELEDLFIHVQHKALLNKILQAKKIVAENRREWATVVTNFQKTKEYDTVNKAEYGIFKKRIHTLENIGKEISAYGLTEVEKGRLEIDKIQKQTDMLIKIAAVIALLWGILVPIIFARQMTSTIVYLSQVADNISKGKIGQEIKVDRKDELGDLAQSIKRMQTSLRIMLKRLTKNQKKT